MVVAQAFSQNNKTLEEVGLDKEEMKVKYRDVAEKQARRHLILDKLIDQEKLDMTEEEMDASFEEMAQAMNASTDAVKNYFNMDPRQLEYFKHTQLEKKAIDLIIEKGNVTEVEPKTDAPEAEEEAADGAAED